MRFLFYQRKTNYFFLKNGNLLENEVSKLALNMEKTPRRGGEKNHEKTNLLYVVQIHGTRESIYIGKVDRDMIT
jgi:hypothetical protein